jgi:hypothetical protein
MRLSITSLSAAVVAAACCTAQAHIVQMRGAPSCAAWLAQRPADAQAPQAWLLGYVSGMAQQFDKNLPADATEEAIFGWMDDYCKRNPQQSVALGGYMYFGKLRGDGKLK